MNEHLAGIKVLDLSNNLPGPYCSRILADLGAEIIKIESASKGDPAREFPLFYQQLNYDKKVIAVDLKSNDGKEKVRNLIKGCNVFLESFKPGVCSRLGLGFDEIKKINPQIIYCSISGFGQTGPLASVPAHDLNLQGFSGFTDISDSKKSFESPLPIADFTAGSHAATAIIAALFKNLRSDSKEAQYIDIAMSEPLAHMVDICAKTYPEAQSISKLIRRNFQIKSNKSLVYRSLYKALSESELARLFKPIEKFGFLDLLPHYGIFKTKGNEKIVIGIVNEQHFWLAFCDTLGGVFNKLRNLPIGTRVVGGWVIRHMIKRKIRTKSADEWLRIFQKNIPLPITKVHSRRDLTQIEQFKQRDKLLIIDKHKVIQSPFIHD